MGKNLSGIVLGLVAAVGVSSMAVADSNLTIRGGYGGSLTDYQYARKESTGKKLESNYGDGLFGQVVLSDDDMFGIVGGEISMSYNRLSGDDKTYDAGSCDVIDVISLSHDSCMRGAQTSNTTQIGQFRVLASRTHSGTGAQLLGGLGVLGVSSSVQGDMIYGTEDSAIGRSNYFSGMGLVLGGKKAYQISNKATLQLEGFAGVYSGNRDLKINDYYEGDTGSLVKQDRQTVYSLDLAASVAMPVESIASGSMFEVGIAYTRLFNVIDETNYNDYIVENYGFKGSADEDVDALSLFFGLKIPL
ncbi:MAG: hypothetical protein ACR2O2_12695 [Ruegeria sp.]